MFDGGECELCGGEGMVVVDDSVFLFEAPTAAVREVPCECTIHHEDT